ncbi:MAG: alkaline phosphatase family protein [Candidatus Aenigmarchaeota archaeon]|nr:alkaline phosphatase family protein [Candidatus Aenigmarchaeota archaeon]
MNRVFVFGIDGAPPELVFERWLDELPTIKALIKNGMHANVNSTIPPSTIIAWNSMFSGKDTSEIGVFSYTFRDEQGTQKLVSSNNVKCDLIWDIVGRQNKKTIALYVPLSYPAKPINGAMVSCFLTPSADSDCAYPEAIKNKIKAMKNPEMFFDVAVGLAGHKGVEISELIERTYEMTEMQLSLLEELLVNEWDLFITVMIGTDRLQHMLWNHFDETHRNFIKDSKFKNALKEYYIYLDKRLGNIIEKLKQQDKKNNTNTTVMVASDHGMAKQEGKININNWLVQEGYLFLNPMSKESTKFNIDLVDMTRSIAYGSGAYNARIYINKKLAGKDYDKIKREIAGKLMLIKDDKGNQLETKVYFAEDIYKDTNDLECSDLTVYFDDLRWASNPDLGQEGLYSWKTAIGADTAGHSRQGIIIINNLAKSLDIDSESNLAIGRDIGEIDIRQVCPTILKLLNIKIPTDIESKPIEVAG